jgi:hypothetical protein
MLRPDGLLYGRHVPAYRIRQEFDHFHVYLAMVVQAIVPSNIRHIVPANPVNGDRQVAVINASWGLEAIVSGLVTQIPPGSQGARKSVSYHGFQGHHELCLSRWRGEMALPSVMPCRWLVRRLSW